MHQTIITLHQHPNRVILLLPLHNPRARPRAALEHVATHARTAAVAAFQHFGLRGCGVERLEDVLLGNGRALDVIQPPVARLTNDGCAVFKRDL